MSPTSPLPSPLSFLSPSPFLPRPQSDWGSVAVTALEEGTRAHYCLLEVAGVKIVFDFHSRLLALLPFAAFQFFLIFLSSVLISIFYCKTKHKDKQICLFYRVFLSGYRISMRRKERATVIYGNLGESSDS